MLIVDDLSHCDGLTQRTVVELARASSGHEPVLLVTAGDHDRGVLANETIRLQGLNSGDAERVPGRVVPSSSGVGAADKLTESIGAAACCRSTWSSSRRSGSAPDDGPPPRLADAIAQRIERVDVDAQRLLQSAAVLGRTCELDTLRAVSENDELTGLDELSGSSLVQLDGSKVSIVHPFIADLVAASIPAEARRALHRRAYEVLSELRAPQEVRAAHAYRGVDPVTSLVDPREGGRCGDERGAITSARFSQYRRALELARRQTLESGDTVYDRAIATFSRKLGEALGAVRRRRRRRRGSARGDRPDAAQTAPSEPRCSCHWDASPRVGTGHGMP